jgi:hypothetical protein
MSAFGGFTDEPGIAPDGSSHKKISRIGAVVLESKSPGPKSGALPVDEADSGPRD